MSVAQEGGGNCASPGRMIARGSSELDNSWAITPDAERLLLRSDHEVKISADARGLARGEIFGAWADPGERARGRLRDPRPAIEKMRRVIGRRHVCILFVHLR